MLYIMYNLYNTTQYIKGAYIVVIEIKDAILWQLQTFTFCS